MAYKHIFFDLDRTLWDYDTNCTIALKIVWNQFGTSILESEDLPSQSLDVIDFELFAKHFFITNDKVWALYDSRQLNKDELRLMRFRLVLAALGKVNNSLALELESIFVSLCPKQGAVLEGTFELLDYLQPNYGLHIITNGFMEVQKLKMESAGLTHYFTTITTSECSGYIKPEPEIFSFALSRANSEPHEAIMIGDNLHTDIAGAVASQIDAIWIKHHMQSTDAINGSYHTIHSLHEIPEILKN